MKRESNRTFSSQLNLIRKIMYYTQAALPLIAYDA